MLDTAPTSTAFRISTRLCLLCYSGTETKQSLVAGTLARELSGVSTDREVVVGERSFEGYTRPFLCSNGTRTGVRWHQGTRVTYASICSPGSCSPYCCRTSPHTAFLLHADCVQTLQRASRTPLLMRDLWSFVSCFKPAYADLESTGINYQIWSFAASIPSANLATFPPSISILLGQMQKLSTELHITILNFTGPCLGLSLITALLHTLPLLERKLVPEPYSRQPVLCSNKVFVRYATIRGRLYIADISNNWRAGMDEVSCASQPDHVLLSLDDLGIRGICFGVKGYSPKPVQAPWYQHDELGDGDQIMLVTKNVSYISYCLDFS
jgi:hypothetical protein